MKPEFTSLRQIIDFRPTCPLCSGKMGVDERYGLSIKKELTWDFREKIGLNWVMAQQEITVDVDTEVITATGRSGNVPVYCANFSGSPAVYLQTPIYNGILYLRLGMGCEECHQYSFVVQILVDVNNSRIVQLPLNSETVAVKDEKGILHEIRNVYTTEQTEYVYFKDDEVADTFMVGSTPLVFPIIPLDLVNPQKTLSRIRNLIVFS